jgi:hypothetical protein
MGLVVGSWGCHHFFRIATQLEIDVDGLRNFFNLSAIIPLSFVHVSIVPVHFTVALPDIVWETSHVFAAVRPCKYAITLLFLIQVLSIVSVWILIAGFFPNSFTVSQTIFEIAFVWTAVAPIVLSVSMRLSVFIGAAISVTVGKFFDAFSMFETLFELAFVSISINPSMDSVSVCFSVVPLSNVGVTLGASPNPGPAFETIDPLALINLSIFPFVLSVAVGFSFEIRAIVKGGVGELFISLALFIVVLPLSLIDSAIGIEHDPKAILFVLLDFSQKYALSISFGLDMGDFPEWGESDVFRRGLIVVEVLNEFIDGFFDVGFFIETDWLGAFFGALLINKKGCQRFIIKIYKLGILGFNSPQH